MTTTTTTRDDSVESAKASLVARVEELGRRFEEAKQRFDIPARIAQHPRAAVGIAFAAGALLGLLGGGGGKAQSGEKRTIGGMITAGIGALVFGAIKDFALAQATTAAKQWIDGQSAGDADV